VVVGGDHSIAIGTWGGVARGLGQAPFGLVWFDAHLDAHTAETTPSMNPHGMSAAVLLGHGTPAFLEVGGGVVRPENLCYIGARDWEAGEMALLRRLGVRVIEMPEVRHRGLKTCIAEAQRTATNGTQHFGLTIDLDGFDPEDAPGVGLRVPGGLRRDEMVEALAAFRGDKRLAALEIVEYVPQLDRAARTAHLVRDLLLALLTPGTSLREAA
jgi:arginase